MDARTLLLIDDDDLSREVLTLFATEAGFAVTPAESGQAALELLAPQPQIILTDLQMPGLSGESLSRLLRAACPQTPLIAMSGSRPAEQVLARYDAFLLKPFTMDDLEAALNGIVMRAPEVAGKAILNQKIYDSLAQSMLGAQLRALYEMCLDDADRRLASMRLAAEAGDADAFTRAAHAIKGGCGMVGATELADLAANFETQGLAAVDDVNAFAHFLAASERLRRMLDAQAT